MHLLNAVRQPITKWQVGKLFLPGSCASTLPGVVTSGLIRFTVQVSDGVCVCARTRRSSS